MPIMLTCCMVHGIHTWTHVWGNFKFCGSIGRSKLWKGVYDLEKLVTKIAVPILAWPGTELTFNNRERFEFHGKVTVNVTRHKFWIWSICTRDASTPTFLEGCGLAETASLWFLLDSSDCATSVFVLDLVCVCFVVLFVVVLFLTNNSTVALRLVKPWMHVSLRVLWAIMGQLQINYSSCGTSITI